MNGFIFFAIFIFFVIPFLKSLNKNAKKPAPRNLDRQRNASPWGEDHGQVKQQRHQVLHRQDSFQVFPEDHADRVRARDKRDRKENRRMETNIHSRINEAMTRVSNKSRSDWGAKGDSGLMSSKGVVVFLLLILLAHFIIVAFAPELLPGR